MLVPGDGRLVWSQREKLIQAAFYRLVRFFFLLKREVYGDKSLLTVFGDCEVKFFFQILANER